MSSIKSLVSKATSDNREAVGGFTLQEIARATLNSIDDCHKVHDLLLKKLSVNKPNVKLKALRCIRFVCEHGRSHFQSEMQRHSDKFKQCAQYSGPLDPVYGMRPYELVREEARGCLEAIFATRLKSDRPKSQMQGMAGGGGGGGDNNHAPQQQQQQSSSRSFTPSGTSMINNDRKPMQGFGNTPVVQSKPSFFDKVKKTVNEKIDSFAVGKNNQPASPSSGGFGNRGHQSSNSSSSGPPGWSSPGTYGGPARNDTASFGFKTQSAPTAYSAPVDSNYGSSQTAAPNLGVSSGAKRQKGRPGGMWADDEDDNSMGSQPQRNSWGPAAPMQQQQQQQQQQHQPQQQSQVGGSTSGADTNSEFESRIVDDITTGGGVRAQPNKADLERFVQRASTLDSGVMCALLDEKLCAQQWQTRIKTLYVIAALLKSSGASNHAQFFASNPDNLLSLCGQTEHNKSVKNKASAVAASLGLIHSAGTSAPAKRSHTASAPQFQAPIVPDLFNTTATVVSQPQDNGGSVQNGFGDILDGLDTTPSQQQQPSDDILGGMFSSMSVQPQPTNTNNVLDPLDGDIFGTGASATQQPPKPAMSADDFIKQAAVRSQPSDAFGGFATQQQQAQQPQQSAFQNLGFGAAQQPTQPVASSGFFGQSAPAPATAASSGFDFMQSSQTAQPPAPAPQSNSGFFAVSAAAASTPTDVFAGVGVANSQAASRPVPKTRKQVQKPDSFDFVGDLLKG